MARTYAAVEIDKDAKPKGWNLMRSPSPQVQLIRKLRKKGFYANFGSLRELELHCVRLSKGPDAEGTGRLVDASGQLSLCSKESSSDIKNCQTEQVQSPLATRVKEADNAARLNQQSAERDTSPESSLRKKFNGKSLVNPSPPYKGLSRNPIIDDWCLTDKDGKTVPIMEVPYAGMNLLCTFTSKDTFLSGYVSTEREGLCTGIEEWKLDLTPEGRLAMYVKTTTKVWTELGKPQIAYEQTIRSILVYMQLFLKPMEASEVSESMLLQHLENKFHYWRVKPDVSDLHESLLWMKKLNLGSTFPIDRLVLSRDMTEFGEMVESDADSDSKPLSFKRSRRHTNAELHAEEALGGSYTRSGSMNRSNTSSFDSEYESLSIKRTPRSRKRRLGADKGHHKQCEVLSPNKSNIDHVLLSSNLHAFKRRKETLQTREDRLVSDKLQRRDPEPEKHQTPVSYQERDWDTVEVESGAMGKANTSAVPLHFNKSLENWHSSDQAGGKQNIIEPDDIKSRITKIMRESSHDTYYGHELGSERLYLTGPFPAVSKLWALTSAAHRALDGLEKGGSLEEAENICPKESLTDFFSNEVSLQEYGVSQFFPSASKQKEVAERINYYAHDGDTVLEICSQAVDYFSLLKERLANLGKQCNYKRYIMNQSQSHDIKKWMNLEGLPTGSKLLVCLSFSFALWGEQSKKILEYALELKPKLIVLIAPLFSRRLEEYTSYNLVWVDSELLQNEILWPWGLMEVPSTALDKRKGISPVVFLWSRTDWTTKHRQIASRFGHLQKPVPSGLRG